ncbi:hypothetical protein MBAV_001420 [Candidatus Magnetobacterium bavaricum]|uniref:Uncharacterized protein n=1 Tax=Candidatus Magnetobacterium bavaricum TaxID=29290 RepID=A0A0F3GWY0_9BACT|nr:hypothetical protein MBAV_001420 [Candidatus Magnetobacterium bavaricum]
MQWRVNALPVVDKHHLHPVVLETLNGFLQRTPLAGIPALGQFTGVTDHAVEDDLDPHATITRIYEGRDDVRLVIVAGGDARQIANVKHGYDDRVPCVVDLRDDGVLRPVVVSKRRIIATKAVVEIVTFIGFDAQPLHHPAP